MAPTPDPACAGVAEWFTTVSQFAVELNAILQPIAKGLQRQDAGRFASGLQATGPAAENILVRFQQIAVPALVADLNAEIVANLQLLVEGLYHWYNGYITGNVGEYQSGSQQVTDASVKMTELQPKTQEIADHCGVQLPTATATR